MYEKIAEKIDQKLQNKPKLKLDEVAKEFAKFEIYSANWFKKVIKSPEFLERHNLKIVRLKKGRRRDVMFIVRR